MINKNVNQIKLALDHLLTESDKRAVTFAAQLADMRDQLQSKDAEYRVESEKNTRLELMISKHDRENARIGFGALMAGFALGVVMSVLF